MPITERQPEENPNLHGKVVIETISLHLIHMNQLTSIASAPCPKAAHFGHEEQRGIDQAVFA